MKTDHVVALISNIRDRSNKLILRELAKYQVYDLAPSHGAILDELFQQDNLPMKVLAARIRRDKSTVTALIDKLVKLDYVKRAKVPDDARITVVSLMARGRKLQPAFEKVSEILISTIYGDFSGSEKQSLVAGLEKMMKNLQTYSRADRPVSDYRLGIERRVS